MEDKDRWQQADAIADQALEASDGDPAAAIEMMARLMLGIFGFLPTETRVALGFARAGLGGRNKTVYEVVVALGAKSGSITREELLAAYDGGQSFLDNLSRKELREHKQEQEAIVQTKGQLAS